LENALADTEPIAVWDPILVSALRILTHPNLVNEDEALPRAIKFLEEIRSASIVVREATDHWEIVRDLVVASGAVGNLVMDVSIAAVAIENGCRLATFDHHFANFRGLEWFEPELPTP